MPCPAHEGKEMSDPFDIQRIRPPTAEGIPRTAKKHTGIQKEDVATESTLDAVKRRESEKHRKRREKERKSKEPPQDSENPSTEGVIDIVI